MLNILEGFDLKALGHNSAEYLHLLVEAKRIAFADRDAYLADPRVGAAPTLQAMLFEGVRGARGARRSIASPRGRVVQRPEQAGRVARGRGDHADRRRTGDTIYLTAADGKGNVVSLIQSLYEAFGAGHRRRRHRHRAAQPRRPVLARRRAIRTSSRRASARSTRWCRRW